MFGPQYSDYLEAIGVSRTGPDPDDDPLPEPPPIWKQVMLTVALSGLVAAVETFARRAIHRLFDGAESTKEEGRQMVMVLAPDEDAEEEDEG